MSRWRAFLRGAASLLDLQGALLPRRPQTDAEALAQAWRQVAGGLPGVTHMCPPDGGSLMPCCGLTPFDAPRTDRITLDPALVTCSGGTDYRTNHDPESKGEQK